MPQHIGIVACSSEGAALCYRTISLEGSALLGKHDHPEVSLHNHSLAEYMLRDLELCVVPIPFQFSASSVEQSAENYY